MDFCEQYQSTFTRGRAYEKNDQCFVEQKNGVVVRQIVGYDRFEGMQAYKQLNELNRATRLWVNFFQLSVKLLLKHRDGAKVQRSYDPAKTPFHRLRAENILAQEKRSYLKNVYESLDLIRLLQQIKKIQDALWTHSVHYISETPEVTTPVTFDSEKCINGHSENLNAVPVEFMNQSLEQGKRRYRRTKRPRVPHTWRTVPDSFEEVWEETCEWLKEAPERTAKSIFEDLQQKYPGKFKDGQFRTMRRYVKAWRSKPILTFDHKWLNEELLVENKFATKFQGKVIREANL